MSNAQEPREFQTGHAGVGARSVLYSRRDFRQARTGDVWFWLPEHEMYVLAECATGVLGVHIDPEGGRWCVVSQQYPGCVAVFADLGLALCMATNPLSAGMFREVW